jgi:hypothetical protein
MGDKSPKSTHKKSNQKAAKANNAAQQKQAAANAKTEAGKKR